MPTPTKGPRLGGGPAHERLMLANLATQLFEHAGCFDESRFLARLGVSRQGTRGAQDHEQGAKELFHRGSP